MTPLRRRTAVLLLWLAAMAAGALVIVRTPFTADLTAFLPAEPDPRQRVLIEQLQSGIASRTLLLGIAGGAPAERVAASRALAAALLASGHFEQVSNGDASAFAGVGEWLFERRYQLSPAVVPEHFTAAGLREAIDESLSLLGTPAGNLLKPILERDPTGETQRIAEALIPARAPRSDDGVWVSRQGDRAVLLATVRAPGADLDAQAAAIAAARGAFTPQAARGLTLAMSGAPTFSVQSRAQIQGEVKWLVITGTVVMSGLLLLAFGSLQALAVAMLPVATGVVAGIVCVSLVFGYVHGITLGFGSTLIGEAVDYAIYYLIQARAAAGSGMPGWRRWLGSGWPTVRLGLLTSLCGFAALMFSGFPGLAQLGVFSVAGLLGAALATRFVLPVLLPDGARGIGLRRPLGALARHGIAVLPRLKWPLLALGAAALLLLLLQRGALWQGDLGALSPLSREALALDERLRADLTASDAGALVIVQGPDAETALVRAEALAARLDGLVDAGLLAGYDSVTRWLPSAATQRARLASLPDGAALRPALDEATRGGPLRSERLGPFVAEVEQARRRSPETLATLRGGPAAPLVAALLLERADGSVVALQPLQPPTGGTVDRAAVGRAIAGLPGTELLDIGSELTRLYDRYLREAQAQALFGALGVVALVGWWLRSWRRTLAVLQPLLLAVLLTLGGLAVLQVPLGILHLVGLLLVVAVGSNYALFFDLLQRNAALGAVADDDTLASLLLANLTTVLSFGLIALSSIPALSAIGRVVAPGALLALLLAAALMPASAVPARTGAA